MCAVRHGQTHDRDCVCVGDLSGCVPCTRSERAAAAVNTLGSATVNGALTTFLGIMPIAFSYYTYFVNYFFLQYVIILVVCLFQGVVVLPVVLSFIGGVMHVESLFDPHELQRRTRFRKLN